MYQSLANGPDDLCQSEVVWLLLIIKVTQFFNSLNICVKR